jgi:hypothetical protein
MHSLVYWEFHLSMMVILAVLEQAAATNHSSLGQMSVLLQLIA